MDLKGINNIKKEILTTCYRNQEGHVASAFSILDILDVLYGDVLNISPQSVRDESRDRFVLSKGHAAIGYYSILKHYGFIDTEPDSMCRFGSTLGGHPDANKVNGIEVSTGSLGHGLPMACGMALGMKIQKEKGQVYCLIGDGEINEGTIWESFLVINHRKLVNLTTIVDYNHSTDRAVDISDIRAKCESFGMCVIEINGHDHPEIKNALLTRKEKPLVIIAHTIKGNGIAEMTNNPAWHHRVPTDEEYNRFLEELS